MLRWLGDAHIVLAVQHHRAIQPASIEGDFPEYSYPTEPELLLKEGAQVMFVKNDTSAVKLYYNGKIGIITHIDDDIIHVKCEGDYSDIPVDKAEWEKKI